MASILNRAMLHGGDYNPDQWLSSPDILARDIELMKQAHVNCVSLAIFAWSALEPEEGVYTFDWLQNVIDRLYENGIYTVLATPSGARPAWMAQKYPEVLRVDETLHRNHYGDRHNHCYTSPIYREKVWEMDSRLSKAFGNHPGVILWHISNEYSGACYCPLCQEEFRRFLKKKYKTLDALNAAYWTGFWSHTYTDWSQIEAPVPRGEMLLHGLSIDWHRFVTQRTVDFFNWEKAAVRAGGSELPVTTNLMSFYYDLDYTKFADSLDLVSWDSYPSWRTDPRGDVAVAIHTAMAHDYMRSLKRQPFLLMENTPNQVNWKQINRLKAPGQNLLAAMQAVAHGSNSVQYFQWRQSRGGNEKFHGAVVDHYGEPDTRVFREVAEVGKTLEQLAPLCKTCPQPQVALILDRENEWAIDEACGPRKPMRYEETLESHYQAFWRLGIGVDVVSADADLTPYRLVIAPMLYMYREGVAEKLRAFVEAGGTLVGTYWSGLVDENDLCYLGPTPAGGMHEVFGVRYQEIDPLRDTDENAMTWNGRTYALHDLCELVEPLADRWVEEGEDGPTACFAANEKTAEILACYEKDFYAGYPALTVHNFGKGKAYYLASRAEDAFYVDFYTKLAGELSLSRALDADLPEGVTATLREGEGCKVVCVQNFNTEPVSISLRTPVRPFGEPDGEAVTTLSLPGYGFAFVTP